MISVFFCNSWRVRMRILIVPMTPGVGSWLIEFRSCEAPGWVLGSLTLKKGLGVWTIGRAKGGFSCLSLRESSIEDPGQSSTSPKENHRYLLEDGNRSVSGRNRSTESKNSHVFTYSYNNCIESVKTLAFFFSTERIRIRKSSGKERALDRLWIWSIK